MKTKLLLVNFTKGEDKYWNTYVPDLNTQLLSTMELQLQWEELTTQTDPFIIVIKILKDVEWPRLYNFFLEVASSRNFLAVAFIFHEPKLLESIAPLDLTKIPKLMGVYAATNQQMHAAMLPNIKNIHALYTMWHQLGEEFKTKITQVSGQFDQAIEKLEKQLLLSQKKYVKHQKEKFITYKNVHFDYQYRVGSNSGAEYSDFVFMDSWIIWLNFSCDSYAVSSILLKFVEECRQHKDKWVVPELHLLQELLNNLIDNFQKVLGRPLNFDYCFILLNSMDLSLSAMGRGNYFLATTSKQDLLTWDNVAETGNSIGVFKHQLVLAEKLVLLTPGLKKNILNNSKWFDVQQFIAKHLEQLRSDILTEVFVMIETDDQAQFLDFDTNLVYGEITNNGLKSV